jgi:phage terminase large subunit GpA-like protein
MASQEGNISIAMLTTVQNDYSLSYQFTDPVSRPSWNGRRFGMVLKWPDEPDMWQAYIDKRRHAQIDGDQHGREAVEYYLENKTRMDAGVEMLSDHYVSVSDEQGELVHSAIQAAYNKISDTSFEAYQTEYQNEPPKKAGPQSNGLTYEMVCSRKSGLSQYQVPANASCITIGIDLGKYSCHWIATAWWKGAGGCVIDYGVAEVHGTEVGGDLAASEPQVYRALLNWREEILAKEYVDATGTRRQVDHVFVDSGALSNAAYEFVRQCGSPFHCVKGMSPYYGKRVSTNTIRAGKNMHASLQQTQKVWLFELDSDYWKKFVHERFMSPTFDEANMMRRGALSLYAGGNHISLAKHITSEELVSEFKEGRGLKTYWNKVRENNHWLDALYYSAAASQLSGIDLLAGSDDVPASQKVIPKERSSAQSRPKQSHKPHNFRSRNGGWIKGLKKK